MSPPLLSQKALLSVAAVLDVAVHAAAKPVPAKALAARHRLPARHLEPLLQALVRAGILKGVRGPYGGYQLGRDGRRISAEEILRAAEQADEAGRHQSLPSNGVLEAVRSAFAEAERSFFTALARINIADMAASAGPRK
jgi:Rrf2 family protein